MSTINFENLNLTELNLSESINCNGGHEGVAHDVGEAVGYFFGYLFTAGPKLIERAAEIFTATRL